MAGFDFSVIGNIVGKINDTDVMSIGRRMEITNPDGSIGETDPSVPIYENIPCHIDIIRADNPEATVGAATVPIIVGIEIHCSTDIDLRNNDFVKAYRLAPNGEVMEIYEGAIGFPSVWQSRQSVQMAMRTQL